MTRLKFDGKTSLSTQMQVFLHLHDLDAKKELKFHPKRRWRFDYAFPELKIAIEIEGGQWSRSRHRSGAGFVRDCEKYNAAAMLGWRVLRFTTDHFEDDHLKGSRRVELFAVLGWIKGLCKSSQRS